MERRSGGVRRSAPRIAVLVVAALQLAACSAVAPDRATANKLAPAKVERVPGSDLSNVILTPAAAQRLDIQTAPVRDAPEPRSPGRVRRIIPYAAVLYDARGVAWAYTSPAPLVFVRHRLVVDYVSGDLAVLIEGPPPGTAVVTVGAVLLYGTEFGVGH